MRECMRGLFFALARIFRESETTIKIEFTLFRGGGREKIVQNAIFHGKRHDNKILKVKFLLSRNFVVMAQAPIYAGNILEEPCPNILRQLP